MTGFDVYTDEMPNNRFSDQDVELLLSGRGPESVELAELAPILRALHHSPDAPSEERVEILAAQAAEAARATKPEAGMVGKPARRKKGTLKTLKRKLAGGLATIVALSGMTGVAAASDSAAPGDALYGIDRALEAIGLGDGGPAERISEAQALFNDGLVSEAIAHAAEAFPAGDESNDTTEIEESVEVLRAAAESVTSTDSGEADEVRAKVSEMLSWMADNASGEAGLSGRDFGQEVARFARSISGDAEDTADQSDEAGPNAGEGRASKGSDLPADPGPPDEVPGGPPQGTPGPPDGTPGPPDGTPGPPEGTPGRP